MKTRWVRISSVIVVILIIALAMSACDAANNDDGKKTEAKKLPKLLELGSTKCIPCKMMAPIIEEIKKEYKGQLEVEFVDVWKDKKAAEKYKIKSIPTQIFFNAKGKEVARHTGFYSKKNILKTFEKHGIKLKKPKGKK